MKKAIYPGTFDPPTLGHIDIAKRALDIFDEVIIAIGIHYNKKTLFSINERIELWSEIFPHENRIKIKPFSNLIVEFAKENNAGFIVRGLRAISDFEYELQMASTNRDLDGSIDTIFFTAKGKQLFVSSTVVKEIAFFGGEVCDKAPKNVCKALKEKYNQKN